jgi:hypothetical protein
MTLQAEFEKLREAIRDLIFEMVKSLGLIWLVGKIPFLDYKDWVKKRMKGGE